MDFSIVYTTLLYSVVRWVENEATDEKTLDKNNTEVPVPQQVKL